MQNKIQKGSTTITDSSLFGGVNYEHNINYSTNITLGNVPSACISFTAVSGLSLNVGDTIIYSKKSNADNSFVTIGKFIIDEKKSINSRKDSYTAYDYISKFNDVVDDWYNAITYPITLQNFFNSLVTHCVGSTYTTTLPINGSYSIAEKPFTGQNFKGKDILSLIASFAGGYACVDINGKVYIKNLSTASATTLTGSKYIKADIKTAISAPVAVVYSATSDSAGVSYPASYSGKSFHIINNPLMNNLTSGSSYLQNIYNKVHFSYYPMTVTLYEDYGIKAGDAITVNGKTGIVFDKIMTSSGVTLTCTGEEEDEVMPTVNTELSSKFGKTFKLTQDINGISVDVSALDDRMETAETQIGVQAGQIATKVSQGSVISAINQTAETITIAASKVNLSGYTTFSDLSTSATTTIINGANIRTGTINADRIDVNNLIPRYLYYTGASEYGIPQYRAGEYTDDTGDMEFYISAGNNGPELRVSNAQGNMSASMSGFNINKAIVEWAKGSGNAVMPVMQIVECGVSADEGYTFQPTTSVSSDTAWTITVSAGTCSLKNLATSSTSASTISGTFGQRVSVYNVGSNGVRLTISTTTATTYTVSTSVSPTGAGTTTGAGTYISGTSVTVRATPATGYTFSGWYQGSVRVSIYADYTFTLQGNRTLQARFTEIPVTTYRVTLNVDGFDGDVWWTNDYGTQISYIDVAEGSTKRVRLYSDCVGRHPITEDTCSIVSSGGSIDITFCTDQEIYVDLTNVITNYTVTAEEL